MKRTPSMKFPYPGVLLGLVVWILIILSACAQTPDTNTALSRPVGVQRPALDIVDDTAANVRCYLARGELSGYVSGVITTISCVRGAIR